jgi:hypothetical protein
MGYKKISRLTDITFNQEQHHGGAHEQILEKLLQYLLKSASASLLSIESYVAQTVS